MYFAILYAIIAVFVFVFTGVQAYKLSKKVLLPDSMLTKESEKDLEMISEIKLLTLYYGNWVIFGLFFLMVVLFSILWPIPVSRKIFFVVKRLIK